MKEKSSTYSSILKNQCCMCFENINKNNTQFIKQKKFLLSLQCKTSRKWYAFFSFIFNITIILLNESYLYVQSEADGGGMTNQC
jgi:hypothetical protein